jgi:hypothetical protein
MLIIPFTLQSPDDSLQSFFGWVRIFVAHFLAKRTLEFQCARLFQTKPESFEKPRIKILSVNSDTYEVPPWDQFKCIIREALKDVSEDDVELIIEIMEMKIRSGHGLSPVAFHSLNFFRKIVDGEEKSCILCMHCEAVFAALLEARHRVQLESSADTDTDTELKRLAEISKVLGLLSRCKNFHSYFSRP